MNTDNSEDGDMAIKFNMAKTYDKVERLFLERVMAKLGSIVLHQAYYELFTAMSKIKPFPPYSTILSLSRNLELLGLHPDHCTIGIFTTYYCHLGRVNFGLFILGKVLKLGFPLNSIIFTALINGLIQNNHLDKVVKLLDKVVKQGLQPEMVVYEMVENKVALNVETYSILIDMHCKEGWVDEARTVIEFMISRGELPNIITYNTLLDGYCLHGQMDEALELKELMERNGCKPDVVTLNTLINGYCKSKNIDRAISMFQGISRKGIVSHVVAYNTLTDGLCKANKL
ncbi:hypothetical protein Cgig2_005901 [Carnegiea gigantea]|uniref:Pentatricopeptide repeat-containing protein n=1 Tax=Carnegiea gigantea TaxID=171969 RepID=A0A9Q1Q519_9CARY|nr:hypothetical protein Cgig2_005901 [Carnegiea gigantea]